MNLRDIPASIIRILLSIMIVVLGLFLFTKSIIYRFYIFPVAYSLTAPIRSMLSFTPNLLALLVPIIVTSVLMINSILKMFSSKVESSTRIFTGLIFLMVILSLINYSDNELLKVWPNYSNPSIDIFYILSASASVVTIHFILKYISSQDDLRNLLEERDVDKKSVQKYQIHSYGYTILIGSTALFLSLAVYFGSNFVNDNYSFYLSDPYQRIIFLVIVIFSILVGVYLFIDNLLYED